MIHDAHHHRHHSRNDAHKHDAHDEQLRVVVANVRQLVADDASQFVVIEQVHQPRRHRHRVAFCIDAARKCVELWVVDHVNLRHIHVASHAEVLHNVIQAWIFLPTNGACACGMLNHRRVAVVGNDKPHAHDAHYPRQHLHEIGIHSGHVERARPFAVDIVIATFKIMERRQERPHHSQNDERKHCQQQPRQAVVAADLRLHAYIFHRLRTLLRVLCLIRRVARWVFQTSVRF